MERDLIGEKATAGHMHGNPAFLACWVYGVAGACRGAYWHFIPLTIIALVFVVTAVWIERHQGAN